MRRSPNIILILLDSVRADRLSCYGYRRKTTPFVDAIASEGVLYEQAISPANWTLPSHVSIFTGMFPSKHGAHRTHHKFDRPYRTLAELLGKEGYRSAAFFVPGWLNETTGATRGFSEIYDGRFWQSKQEVMEGQVKGKDKSGHMIIEGIKEWVLRKKDDGPFFLFVNLFEAHNPYDPPEPYRSLYLSKKDLERIPKINRDITRYYVDQKTMDEKDFETLGNLYDGEISYQDHLVERLVELLGDKGVLDESVLIITADHGENIGDHGHWGHRYCLYDSLIRVPLIIRYPGCFEGGKRVTQYVQTVDIYPTLMDILGLDQEEVRKELQGESLLIPALSSRKRVFTVSEFMPKPDLRSYEEFPGFDASIFSYGLTAIRFDGYKLIFATPGRHEFYHLTWDPEERGNIFSESSVRVRTLWSLLEEWQQTSKVFQSGMSYSLQEDPVVDEGVKTQLRALGYMD